MHDRGAGPNPESIIRTANGREVQLKVHRGLWSGTFPENSLPAIEECYREAVARTEIDVHTLRDGDFLVIHDRTIDRTTDGMGSVLDLTRRESQALRLSHEGKPTAYAPPLFSELVAMMAVQSYPTLVELDLPDVEPMPWPRVEELARIVQPVKDRVIFNGADWNLRRLAQIDSTLPMSFDPGTYLDWLPEGHEEESESMMPRGAYGYFDAHPLARERIAPVDEYLDDRLSGIALLVPGAREAHVSLLLFERMLDDGVAEAANIFHRRGLGIDVWTLNAGTPGWRERLTRALNAGVDVITSDTPRILAAACREGAGEV